MTRSRLPLAARGVLCACACVLGLGACGSTSPTGEATSARPSTTGATQSPTGSPTPSAPREDPVALVGLWLVEAPSAPAGTILRIGDDLSVWSTCGYLMGSWRADENGLFAGSVTGGDFDCFTDDRLPRMPWLDTAGRYTVDGPAATLSDSTGVVVAHLRRGGTPTPGSNLLPSLADPPVVTAPLRDDLRPGSPPRAALRPATPSELVGTWVSASPRRSSGLVHQSSPGATVSADGSLQTSDGCNGSVGRWTADEQGHLLAAMGGSTLVGCDNVPVDNWFARARWAGFDGEVLVLVDADGGALGRLRKA